ncbi:MAG TPA: tRNA lysidine(34) synthetase TilS [Candidatus Coprosoma intestinipullorum]|uniref:tRNA(Ile)-lysidine synthase n=1 Tax=Candidatus Coprosoma intestinipullorum TaxID=2840752 RepID=A0A9D1CZC1_9FIRM|nr:tRNA lysidine(34) synthetase TilS [Candidatus Coprosoma intestinipullorum]
MDDILKKLDKTIKENETLITATSGGPDSMALLSLLIKLSQTKNITIICAHVNHNLRKESQEEALMVEKYANENNIIFEKMEINHYEGNTENYARTQRYNFFEKLIKKYNATYLLTAHHGDDLTETILMRMVRGSSLKGYSGFQEITDKETYKIYRPLITKTKDELLNYVKTNNIPYAVDKTNFSEEYTRNRYRLNILPILKKENKSVHLKFLKFSETLKLYDDHINKEANEKLNKVYQNNNLNLKLFENEDELIKRKILYQILNNLYYKNISLITDNHVELILNIIESSRPNLKINLPSKVLVIKNYQNLYFTQNTEIKSYSFTFKDKVILPNNQILIKEETEDTSNYTIRLNSKELSLPLIVRTRQNGDKMEIKNLNGHKKIKDIFINEKISETARNSWPILTDQNNQIIWLPGLKKSKFDKQKHENYDIIIRYR